MAVRAWKNIRAPDVQSASSVALLLHTRAEGRLSSTEQRGAARYGKMSDSGACRDHDYKQINKQSINNKQGRTELSQNSWAGNSWAGNSWGGNAPPEDFLAQYSDPNLPTRPEGRAQRQIRAQASTKPRMKAQQNNHIYNSHIYIFNKKLKQRSLTSQLENDHTHPDIS